MRRSRGYKSNSNNPMAKSTEKQKSFEAFINESELPVLVDFWAAWCGPCKMMEPVIKEVAPEFKGRLKVIKVNVDKKPHIAAQYQVQGIPTFILFKNGQPVWRTSGAVSKTQLKKQLEQQL